MYKIYINDIAVLLTGEEQWRKVQQEYANDDVQEVVRVNKDFSYKDFIEKCLKDSAEKNILLVHQDPAQLKNDFEAEFKIIKAGGGVVRNDQDDILLIYRKGKWDLPKGKLDDGESVEEAALREVKEETGLEELKMIRPVIFPGLEQKAMMHIYREDGKLILKNTFWYEMQNMKKTELEPEEGEGITEVKWVKPEQLGNYFNETYRSLHDIFYQYIPS